MTVRIEGIRLQDVATLMATMHDKWLSDEFDLKEEVIDFDELVHDEMGLKFTYSQAEGPIYTRHYLKGERWMLWIDMTTVAVSSSQGTRQFEDENLLYFSEGRSHRLITFELRGDPMDFERDMVMARTIGVFVPNSWESWDSMGNR